MKKTKHRLRFWLITVTAVLVVIFLILPFSLTIIIYKQNFGSRFETYEPWRFETSDFEGLTAQKATFESNNKQLLTGYIYSKENEKKKGVVVIAHGFGGGGHTTYMSVADYFASNGYKVFAYDATGNDESGGEAVNGLPQGVIDLDYALRYVKQAPELKDLPIMLFGHSWGGYSVCSVLTAHPDVKAVASMAGFINSTDMIKEEGRRMMGDKVLLILPYASIYEKIKFGKYAGYNGVNGLRNSNAKALLAHSEDDYMISIKNSFDVYYDEFKDNPRFTFVRYTNKGHNNLFSSSEAIQYEKDYSVARDEYFKKSGVEVTHQAILDFMKQYEYDRVKRFDPDLELMEKILKMYDSIGLPV